VRSFLLLQTHLFSPLRRADLLSESVRPRSLSPVPQLLPHRWFPSPIECGHPPHPNPHHIELGFSPFSPPPGVKTFSFREEGCPLFLIFSTSGTKRCDIYLFCERAPCVFPRSSLFVTYLFFSAETLPPHGRSLQRSSPPSPFFFFEKDRTPGLGLLFPRFRFRPFEALSLLSADRWPVTELSPNSPFVGSVASLLSKEASPFFLPISCLPQPEPASPTRQGALPLQHPSPFLYTSFSPPASPGIGVRPPPPSPRERSPHSRRRRQRSSSSPPLPPFPFDVKPGATCSLVKIKEFGFPQSNKRRRLPSLLHGPLIPG